MQRTRAGAPSRGDGQSAVSMSSSEIRQLIAETAYFRAEERGFAPGHEMEDWLNAEAQVRMRLGAVG